MLSKEMQKAISDQINYEIFSGYTYLAMSAALEGLKLPGAAHWMRIQADEELIHANIFYTYMMDSDASIDFAAIAKPKFSAASALTIFSDALNHERIVTSRIKKLAALAMKEADFTTLTFLNFFLTEQVQEEKSAQQIIDRLTLGGESQQALLFIDAELALRPPATPPAAAATL